MFFGLVGFRHSSCQSLRGLAELADWRNNPDLEDTDSASLRQLTASLDFGN